VEITAVRIRLVHSKDSKLKAFACVSLENSFVIRDIKVISRPSGLFVAMPSRKLTFCCPRCNTKNHLRAKYCNNCGARLSAPRAALNGRGRVKLYADVAHPITPECREMFHQKVIAAYEDELVKARQPEYAEQQSPGNESTDEGGWDDFSGDMEMGMAEPPQEQQGQ
jgi:stage V sporulation protein G